MIHIIATETCVVLSDNFVICWVAQANNLFSIRGNYSAWAEISVSIGALFYYLITGANQVLSTTTAN